MTAAALLALAAPAVAHISIYEAPLLGSSEVPAAATLGSGFGRVTIDFDLVTMRVEATFAGLTGNTTNSHIHCCIAPGANVRVATQLPTFTGFPSGVKAGSFDGTFNMSLASSYNPDFITANGGTVGSAFNALVAGLDAGRAYLNVHTTSFGGGEIRGLLVPVPEPETYALMLAGLAAVGALARRRKAG
ncbi:CHRD domain-containing protein [Rubrivivax sp. A210]|uniref:CHRD domain-containing protein n=1 Tax=Rubrivivax sp. A210 TaxID=2772301 RepID=UPI001F3E15A2|nr:CHRD domain-containing protein [Rubrivivax sp. A210]